MAVYLSTEGLFTINHQWKIKDLLKKLQDKNMEHESTELLCENGNGVEYVKFKVGFIKVEADHTFRLYWKILQQHNCLRNKEILLKAKFLRNGLIPQKFKEKTNAELGKIIEAKHGIFSYAPNYTWTPELTKIWTNPEGSLIINLKITLKSVPVFDCIAKLKEVQKTGNSENSQNISAPFKDPGSFDLQIVTKDKTVFYAQKSVLEARCPAFAKSFSSNFLENSPSVLNVDDISAKTMKNLLTVWYTGELESSWKDDDIAEEFTYAAEKYQMTDILNNPGNLTRQ